MLFLSRKWWTIVALCLMLLLTNIDLTAVNLALAHIAQDFRTSLATLQWVMIGYLLALAASIVLGGDLGDKLGRKRMFLIGTAIFIVASIFAGLAQNSWQLIIARVIQGFSMAMVFPQTVVIAMFTFPAEQQGLAIGVIGGAAGISQAIGPTIGGYLLTWLSWRWIFLINIPIGLIVILFGALAIKESSGKSQQIPIDYIGSCLLIIALTLLLLALSQLPNWGVVSLLFFGCLLSAIVFFVIFFTYESRIKTPLIPLKLLYNRTFLVGAFIRFLFVIGFSTILFIMGLYLQNIRGLSADHAGFVMLALTIVFGVGSIFGGRMVDRYGNRSLMSIGMLFFVAGFVILSLIDLQDKFMFLLLALILLGVGLAVLTPATTITALSKIPDDKKGIASGVFYGLTFLAFSLGVVISTTLISSVASLKFKHLLNLTNIHLNHAQLNLLKLIYTGTHDPNIFLSQYGHVAKLAPLVNDAQLSFMSGFHVIMLFCAFVSLIAFIIALVVDY